MRSTKKYLNNWERIREFWIFYTVMILVYLLMFLYPALDPQNPDWRLPKTLVTLLAPVAYATWFILVARKSVPLAFFTMMPLALLGALILGLTTNTDMRLGATWFYMIFYGYLLAFTVPDRLYGPPKDSKANLVKHGEGFTIVAFSSRKQVPADSASLADLLKRMDGKNLALVRKTFGSRALEAAGGENGKAVLYYSDNVDDLSSWRVFCQEVVPSKGARLVPIQFGNIEATLPEYIVYPVEVFSSYAAKFDPDGVIDIEDRFWLSKEDTDGMHADLLS